MEEIQGQTLQQRLPAGLKHLAESGLLAAAHGLQRQVRRAEAEQISRMLAYQDQREREIAASDLPVPVRAEARKAAVRDMAVVLGSSERAVTSLLNCTRFVRAELPRVWRLFQQGEADLPRVRLVARTAVSMERPQNVEALDRAAAGVMGGRNLGSLQAWLNRFVAGLDQQEHESRCRAAYEDRHVRVVHGEDGMSLVQALIPTTAAAVIEKRLSSAARGMDVPGEAGGSTEDTDPRTLAQREADLLTAWLLDGRVDGSPVEAKIAIMIPEATLAGASEQPGISADRRWAVPAEQARRLASAPGAAHEWYEVRCAEEAGPGEVPDILAVRYRGRFAPARLRDAITFRDGTCQAAGCMVPTERSDIDHQLPWPAGASQAANLWALCRRHHRMKTHGYLDPPLSVEEEEMVSEDERTAVPPCPGAGVRRSPAQAA